MQTDVEKLAGKPDPISCAGSLPRDKGPISLEMQSLEWITAEEAEDQPKRFTMTAYTGGTVMVPQYFEPVVFDLAGVRLQADVTPILLHHDRQQIVGHAQVEITARTVKVDGVVSGGGEAAEEVLTAAKRGFPWKASITVVPEKLEYVERGTKATANGRSFAGPVIIVRGGVLPEVSFVPIAADPKTSVKVAAAAPSPEESHMDFDQWLSAKGFDKNALSEGQIAALQLAYDTEHKPADPPADPPPANPITAAGQTGAGTETPDTIRQRREAEAAEVNRIQAIHAACKQYSSQIQADALATIEAQAITDGWDAMRCELALLKAERPKGPAIHVAPISTTPQVLECAIRLGSGDPEPLLLKRYGEQTMEKAHPYRSLGLKGVIQACCMMEGRAVPHLGAGVGEWIRCGFSTASLATLLSNSANKTMMDAYQAVASVAKVLARKLSANDFKTHTGVQLTGDFLMQEVGPDGELKHANVGQDSFTYAVKTFGRIFGITRQMLKNDDLGAFMDIPRMIGRGAALSLEDAFWTLVLANTGSFFVAGNANYISGAATALSSAALAKAVETFRKQTDPDGHPIKLTPKFLVVPPELESTADELYVARNLVYGGSDAAKQPDANTHAGKYAPQVSSYLSNSSYTGYSATAWYLWGDPADIPAFGIAYLDGQENPTVEEAPLAADILGTAWRGYFDFGVCQINHRGAVKSKGGA